MKKDKILFKVDPGACGFVCEVEAKRISKHECRVNIRDSQCEHVKRLAQKPLILKVKDIFAPVIKNKVYHLALECGCHVSCVIPLAIIKASEVVLELAVPKNVFIKVDN